MGRDVARHFRGSTAESGGYSMESPCVARIAQPGGPPAGEQFSALTVVCRRMFLTGESQPEGGHLLAVANQQDIAGQRGVVPGFALDRREAREFGELIGSRLDQRQLAFF